LTDTSQSHLEYLFPSELQDDWQLEDYADLFKEAGDCLRETGHHSEALSFYEPLLATTEILDSRFYFDIAMCYQALGRQEDVRAAINHIRYGENNPMAQIGLAKLYRAQGRIDLMWRLCIELRKRNLHDLLWKEGLPVTRPRDISEGDEAAMEASVPKTGRANKLKHRPTTKYKTVTARKQAEQLRDVIVKAMYDELKDLEDPMKQGDSTASAEWMRIAAEMFEEFRAQSRFFPKDKSKPYMGEGWSNREIRMEMIDILNPKKIEFERPKEWRQIPLDEWAGLLSHYAICLANENNTTECWNVINTIEKATVIYPEPERYHLVRVASLRKSSNS
jgi:general transcription factor 3C polypeptide 3 (transcription factor C subunit 4)